MHAKDFALQWRVGLGLLLTTVLLGGCASVPDAETPGATSRTLSRQEVDGLLLGRGMGMAAVAEINGYPGPQHVLDLKDALELTPDQRFATSRLVGRVQGQARALGQRIVDAERRLDQDMAAGSMSSDQVRARLETIAALRAQLRFTHIQAHIEQKKILTPDQVRRYYELRGREVTLAAPAMPPAPTEPLTLPARAAPAPVAPAEAPAAPPAFEPPAESAPPQAPAMTPGMRDALPDAEPPKAPPLPEEASKDDADPVPAQEPPAYPLTPMEETQPRALLPAPETSEEDDDEPTGTADADPPAEDAAPEADRPAMTPGVQDALEFASPAPGNEAGSVRIAPLEEGDYELEELETVDEDEPATVDLDN